MTDFALPTQPTAARKGIVFLAVTALAGLLVAAFGGEPSTAAIAGPPSPLQAALGEEESEEAEEEESEEEIEVEFEFEEGEGESDGAPPPACLLRRVEPRLVARFNRNDLRLSLRYTSESSTWANVSYWLKGARGTARLGTVRRHLGRRGKLTLGRHLDDRMLGKLQAARVIVVELRVPGTPRLCKPYLTMRLTEELLSGHSAAWYVPL